jgi:hypothetical protein
VEKLIVWSVCVGMLTVPAVALACTSDYSCPYGLACVKRGYDMQGECMVPVDSNGMRDYGFTPRSRSIDPGNGGGCWSDVDCEPGFQCDKRGRLTGACVQR